MRSKAELNRLLTMPTITDSAAVNPNSRMKLSGKDLKNEQCEHVSLDSAFTSIV